MVIMFESTRTVLRKLVVSFTLAALVLPSVANAQALPSYAHPAPQHEQLTGTVSSFDGKYVLVLNDDRGYLDTVQLRDGTIINPTGLRLIEGMRLTVTGYTSGKTFVALQIDTPYTMTSALPPDAPAYYDYGTTTAYPYYSGYPGYYGAYYPWYYPVAAFGLGLAFSAAFFYGGYGCCGFYGYRGGYGYHGGYYGYRGGYGYHGGYNNGYHGGYNNGYHGGYNNGGYHGGYSNTGSHGMSGGGGMHASGGGMHASGGGMHR
jgi:hypothetical protein